MQLMAQRTNKGAYAMAVNEDNTENPGDLRLLHPVSAGLNMTGVKPRSA